MIHHTEKVQNDCGSSTPCAQRGAASVESAVVVLVLITMLLGVFQGLLAYRAKISLNHAVTEAARTGAVNQAKTESMRIKLYEQMSPLYGGWGTDEGAGLIESIAKASADMTVPAQTDGAGLQLHILSPTVEAFDAFGETNVNDELEIPNHHLKHRSTTIDLSLIHI